MSDLHKILKEEYEKKAPITPNLLIEMIEEMMGQVCESPVPEAIVEEANGSGERSVTITSRAIPAPSVSELAWANLQSNDRAAAASRQELEQWLEQIEGSTLRIKLEKVSRMLTNPKYAQSLISHGDTVGERIASTLSYLVFFKTLTTVITNFNASSAGFNFEAFLAVLLGGSQIPASGATTIADLTTADGTPISLKLYAEKTVKAGGSYNDLVGDLVRAPMQYVVATKDLSGKSTEREGTIKFYAYDLTVDNICNILYWSASDHNDYLIRLPESVIQRQRGSSLSFKVPHIPSLGEVTQIFADQLRRAVQAPYVEGLIGAIDFANTPSIFTDPKRPGTGRISGLTSTGKIRSGSTLAALLDQFKEENEVEFATAEMMKIIFDANEVARAEVMQARAQIAKVRGRGVRYAGPRASLKFYNNLSLAEKRRALLYTWGYANSKNQYELRRNDIMNIERLAAQGNPPSRVQKVLSEGNSSVFIGELKIGQTTIQGLLDALVNDLNRSVFEIFEQLSMLEESLQGYFAGGLKDPNKATTAIAASSDIGVKTQELQTQQSTE